MFRSLFASLLLCLTLPVQAGRFTLESAVQHALGHNPELAAARFSIAEAQGRLLQSGRRNNPELESEFRPNVRGREFSYGVGFVQKFPLTNRLRLEKAVSQAEITVAEAEVRAAEVKLATAVRTVGVKLLSLEESKELQEQQRASSKELAAAAAKIAGQGEGSEWEAAQFELEAQQHALELLQLEAERAALVGEARVLLGITDSTGMEFTGKLPAVTEPGSVSPELAGRADYQATQARIEAARQGTALAKAQRWEDASIGLGMEWARNDDAGIGLENERMVGVRFSLPLPFWNKNEGKIAEAEALALRVEMEAEALVAQVRAEAAAALGEMKAARRILKEISSTLLPKAREIEAKMAGFYKQGQPGTPLAEVLRAGEKRQALELANLAALRTYHLARIRFNAALGH